jgi:hypothetical protein
MSRQRPVDGWMVRVVFHGAILHFVSRTEPELVRGPDGVQGIRWEPTPDGDTPGYIDWSEVRAVPWRRGRGEEP